MGFSYYSGGVSGGGGTSTDIEHVFHDITPSEASAKQFSLPSTPVSPAKVMVLVQGGLSLRYSIDYDLSGTTFSWSGKPLDGVLDDSDVIELFYPKA